MEIEKRKLGKTGEEVTILGLGGEGILRTFGHEKDASVLINRAIDLGINYFDCARAYSGSESYYGLAIKERREEIFLASKSHARDKEGALSHLRQTLENMKTDHLDLWQVHDVQNDEDVEAIFGPDGALGAFIKAKDEGLVRFIGVTGHHDPDVIRECMERFDFDTVLIPVNPAEPSYKSFLEDVIPIAIKKGMGIIGMKAYLKGFVKKLPKVTSLEPFFRFALMHPISTAVIGCDNLSQLEENVRFAGSYRPITQEESRGLVDTLFPYSRKLMYYKP
jgi:predicted aldo/keto reductase-like oxidoreductase